MQRKIIDVTELRKNFKSTELLESHIKNDPIEQFQLWMNDALLSKIEEPNAMTLATATKDGFPSARIVLLKEVNQQGFIFFTNYNSRKGKELSGNPQAAIVFLWKEIERQIRIEGHVEKIPYEKSAAYFSTRPIESQIGAWVSSQSKTIKNRSELDAEYLKISEKFRDVSIPCPEYWGGYILIPERIEFWQARPGRLHDRIVYVKSEQALWEISRLSP